MLRISWTNAELETLQEGVSVFASWERLGISFDAFSVTWILAIKFLGGTVPTVGTPTGWIGTADKGRRRRGARRACYEELQRLVGPLADKLAYVKVLDNGMCLPFLRGSVGQSCIHSLGNGGSARRRDAKFPVEVRPVPRVPPRRVTN